MLIYDGTVDIEFIDKNDAHKYLVKRKIGEVWLEAKPTMGVTTYCGAMAKDFLAPWAAGLAANYMADHAGEDSRVVLVDKAKKAWKAAAESGANAGKLGHAYVEAILTEQEPPKPTSAEEANVIESVKNAFDKFMADWKPEIKAVEELGYSSQHDFAGTMDFVATIDKKLVIGDWKTTSTSRYNPDGIYASYFAQLGAYSLMYEEMHGVVVDELWAVNLPKDGGEYKLKRLEDLGLTKYDAQAYFLTLKSAYEQNKQFEWSLKK